MAGIGVSPAKPDSSDPTFPVPAPLWDHQPVVGSREERLSDAGHPCARTREKGSPLSPWLCHRDPSGRGRGAQPSPGVIGEARGG